MRDKILFMLDVDGIMTDGSFYYSKFGKVLKKFGADDSDALKILATKISVIFVSADAKGFKISKKRIKTDLGFEIFLVDSKNRIKWAREMFPDHMIIYMGDSFTDVSNLTESDFGISTKNSNALAQHNSRFVTQSNSGSRAVMEACLFVNQEMDIGAQLPSWLEYTEALKNISRLDKND